MFDFLRFFAPARKPARHNTPRPTARHAKPRAVEVLEERRLMTGIINDYPIPAASSDPLGIVAGHDGTEWFTESGANNIASINPTTHVVTEFPIPTPNSGAWGNCRGQGRQHLVHRNECRPDRHDEPIDARHHRICRPHHRPPNRTASTHMGPTATSTSPRPPATGSGAINPFTDQIT